MARDSRLNFADLGLEVGLVGRRARVRHKKVPGFGSSRATVAQIGMYYEFGSEGEDRWQPPRPAFSTASKQFERTSWKRYSAEFGRTTLSPKTGAKVRGRAILSKAGKELRELMRGTVIGYPPPNEPRYAKRKLKRGIATTGVLSGQLVNAIGYRINKGPVRYKG